jgi:hypothetical protein
MRELGVLLYVKMYESPGDAGKAEHQHRSHEENASADPAILSQLFSFGRGWSHGAEMIFCATSGGGGSGDRRIR